MDGPWFRKYTPFMIWPVSWHGWAAALAMFAIFIPCGYLWVNYIDSKPVIAWVGAVIGMSSNAAFYTLVFWKMDRDYSRH